VEVLEYVPHDRAALSWAGAEAAFEQLGLLHTELAGYPSEQLVPPAYAAYATPTQALSLLKDSEVTFRARADIGEYMAVAAARELTRRLLEELALIWPTCEPALASQIIHGDYGADNVLLRGGKVVAVLDFDFMAVRERIFDVAYSLYWTLDRLGDSVQPAAPAPDDLERATQLLRSYNGSARPPLDAIEMEALPLEMARVPLYWIAEAEYAQDPTGQALAYARHLPRSRWLLEHREAIRA
jgi:Ser/Thr protein kinase RdoA (MazF antagonist)